jgi:hypothetical protein
LARQNFQHGKRQRELAKKQKRQEKLQRRQDRKKNPIGAIVLEEPVDPMVGIPPREPEADEPAEGEVAAEATAEATPVPSEP